MRTRESECVHESERERESEDERVKRVLGSWIYTRREVSGEFWPQAY